MRSPMRLTETLVRVAALVAAATAGSGCSSGSGCPDQAPMPTTAAITSAQACQMMEETGIDTTSYGPTCEQVCPNQPNCTLPDSYVSQVLALNPDAGASPGDGGLLTLSCPTGPATMLVTCHIMCGTGRLTEGYGAPEGAERFVNMAYLEAVSVYAFERLERELGAHGAPPSLLREAQRARRDEVRHTAMTARLARERGGAPRLPEAPAPIRARTLLEVALENAVEGCVRETYGAVQGLVEAQTSRDRGIRRAMKSIASDECRHAELAWAVHAWAMPRLSAKGRLKVERAMRGTRSPRLPPATRAPRPCSSPERVSFPVATTTDAWAWRVSMASCHWPRRRP